jgi:hypothetical protein
MVVGESPFRGKPPDAVMQGRLQVPDGFPTALARSLDPASRRPSASDIARAILGKQLLPGSDPAAFDIAMGRSPSGRPFTGQALVDSVSKKQAAGSMPESDLILALCQLAEEGDGETKVRAINEIQSELRRQAPLKLPVFIRLAKVSVVWPDILEQLAPMASQLANRVAFAKDLLGITPAEHAVRVVVKCGVDTQDLVRTLLAFGAKQSEAIANLIVDLLIEARAKLSPLLEVAGESPVYYIRALDRLPEFTEEELLKSSEAIKKFAAVIGEDDHAIFVANINRIPVSQSAEFDRDCSVLTLLIQSGYEDAALRFTQALPYCQRLITNLFLILRQQNPTVLLKLVIQAAKLPPLQPLIRRINVLRMIEVVALAGNFAVAATAAAAVDFPKEMLDQHMSVCETLQGLFDKASALPQKSALCMCLLPFALHTSYVPPESVVEPVTWLLQSDDPTDVARALVFGVVIMQHQAVLERLAHPYNLEAAVRFLRSDAPAHFLYTAARFFLSIAPFLVLNEQTTLLIEDAVRSAINVALRSQDNARLVLIIAQIFLFLPKSEAWIALFNRCDLQKFLCFAAINFATQSKIMEAVQAFRSGTD